MYVLKVGTYIDLRFLYLVDFLMTLFYCTWWQETSAWCRETASRRLSPWWTCPDDSKAGKKTQSKL